MHQAFDQYLHQKWGLTPEQVGLLSSYIQTKEFKKGDYLLREGEICSMTFFVEKGLLRFYGLNANGKEHILQFASENWLVSDRGSVYFNEPSHYYIDAIEDTLVVLVDDALVEKISTMSNTYPKKNERLLHNHIRQLNNRISLLLGATAEERYLHFVQLYPDVMLRVPQWMVASYLGITPESLSRVRKSLATRNSSSP